MQRKTLSTIAGTAAMVVLFAFGVTLILGGVSQNLLTWHLWLILNSLLLFSSLKAGNRDSWFLSAGCTAGVLLVTGSLVAKGAGNSFTWGVVEIIATAGTLATVVFWKTFGAKTAVITSTLAMFTAGLPAAHDAWLSPDPSTWWLWGTLTLSCFLGAASTREWTIQDKFFPVVQFFFNGAMTLIVLLR